MASAVVEKVAYVLIFAIIARKLTKPEFGTYNLILTLLFIGGMLVNCGTEGVIVREGAKNPGKLPLLFANCVFISFFLSLFAWPLMIVVSLFLKYDHDVIMMIGAGGVVLIFMGVGQIAGAIIRAHQRMETLALVSCCISLLTLLLNLFVVWMGGSLRLLIGAVVVGEAVKGSALVFVVHRYFIRLKLTADKAIMVELLKLAAPFAVLMAYGVLVHRLDILMVGWLKTNDDVAIYATAARITDFLALLAGSMVGAIYPYISAKSMGSRKELLNTYEDSIAVFAILGFGTAFAAILLAKPLILFVFGHSYEISAVPLRWLAWAFLFSVLSGPVGTVLIAAGDQMKRLVVLGLVVLACNIGLNLWLIPDYGYNGAAIATCLSAVAGFVGRLLLSRLYFGELSNFCLATWRALFASLPMILVLLCLGDDHLILSVFLGGVVYLVALMALGEFRQPRYLELRVKMLRTYERFF